MRKTIVCLLVITLLLALAACRVTVEKQFCPVVTETPVNAEAALPSDTPEPDIEVQDYKSVEIFWNNGYYTGISVSDERQEIVTDAVGDYMLMSAAWPGADVESQAMYIHTYEKSASGDTAEYYVFEKMGSLACRPGKTARIASLVMRFTSRFMSRPWADIRRIR